MSRSERYIAPSAEEIQRMCDAEDTAVQFEHLRTDLLRDALTRRKKDKLVELLLRLAQDEQSVQWFLEGELGVHKPIALLVHDIEIAIESATHVDECQPNDDFSYDGRAYAAIRLGLSRLIEMQAIDEAKALALKLMDRGSYQIECSDEGAMQEEIEDCLNVVITAVASTSDAKQWAHAMMERDRIGCLCLKQLTNLVGESECDHRSS